MYVCQQTNQRLDVFMGEHTPLFKLQENIEGVVTCVASLGGESMDVGYMISIVRIKKLRDVCQQCAKSTDQKLLEGRKREREGE